MQCYNCSSLFAEDGLWIRPMETLKKDKIGVLVAVLQFTDREVFCCKDCLVEYVEKNNLDVNLDELKIDVIKK